VGALAAARLGLPLVSTLHLIEDAPVGIVARAKRSAGLIARSRFAARTIALSASQTDWYRQLSGSDDGLVVLPNGVIDPGPCASSRRAQMRAELGIPSHGLLVASASLMRPEKGHDLLLDAVRLLSDIPRLTVALAGDGPLRKHLEQRVAADELLRGRVSFLGYVQDVPGLLGAADLVLHTSLADALPTTLMHALAVSTPVVATRVGGIPDIVSPDVGMLAATDPAPIADAVRELAADPARRAMMGSAARARFLERFEATGWVRGLRGVYEEVLEERGLTAVR
jgi:glycosyltransferase involved in cell wall biosynthesis